MTYLITEIPSHIPAWHISSLKSFQTFLHDISHHWNPITHFCMTYLISSLKSHHTFLHDISHLITEIPSHISDWHISSLKSPQTFLHDIINYLIIEIPSHISSSAWHISSLKSLQIFLHDIIISSLKSHHMFLHDISHHWDPLTHFCVTYPLTEIHLHISAWHISSLKSPQSECRWQNGRWHCTCMYVSMYGCGGNASNATFSPTTPNFSVFSRRTLTFSRQRQHSISLLPKNDCQLWPTT